MQNEDVASNHHLPDPGGKTETPVKHLGIFPTDSKIDCSSNSFPYIHQSYLINYMGVSKNNGAPRFFHPNCYREFFLVSFTPHKIYCYKNGKFETCGHVGVSKNSGKTPKMDGQNMVKIMEKPIF